MGLVLRELEAAGLCTLGISLMPGLTTRINPPRTVSVHFPLGRVTGPPFDVALQGRVVAAALEAAARLTHPGTIEKLPFEYPLEGGDKRE